MRKINDNYIRTISICRKEQVKDYIDLGNNLEKDYSKKLRRRASLCLVCYYKKRGAHTNSSVRVQCQVCEEKMVFGNSDTDKICQPCANKNYLCKHCGSDVDLKGMRKNRVLTNPNTENL